MCHLSAGLVEIFACLRCNREFIHATIKRELLGRYRGSALGLFWSFFSQFFAFYGEPRFSAKYACGLPLTYAEVFNCDEIEV
jgi:hypothetical protein